MKLFFSIRRCCESTRNSLNWQKMEEKYERQLAIEKVSCLLSVCLSRLSVRAVIAIINQDKTPRFQISRYVRGSSRIQSTQSFEPTVFVVNDCPCVNYVKKKRFKKIVCTSSLVLLCNTFIIYKSIIQ